MKLLFNPVLSPASSTGWRHTWFEFIHHRTTKVARYFDLALTACIILSVFVVIFDSVASFHAKYSHWLYLAEWFFTGLFTIEYILRLIVIKRPLRYAFSVWGLIDLLSILPTYLSLFLPGTQSLLVVRILRVLRLFRILKLTQYVDESRVLIEALWESRRKIVLFISSLLTIAVVAGAAMYVVEGPEHGYTSIPVGMYWAIVTMTTVGFGDITPDTTLGRFISSALILVGYSIIVVPTGIYTAELASNLRKNDKLLLDNVEKECQRCGQNSHIEIARFCHQCGEKIK